MSYLKYLLMICIFIFSCSYLEEKRSRPNYEEKFNTLLFGSWISIDSVISYKFLFDYGRGTKGNYNEDEFVWKSNNKKVTYSRFYNSGYLSDEYWSEDRYMTFTFIDTNHLILTIEENEFDPEGDPIPQTFTLERVFETDERFFGTWDLKSVFRDTIHHQSFTLLGFVNSFGKKSIIPINMISSRSSDTLEYSYSIEGSRIKIFEFNYDKNYNAENLKTSSYLYTFIKDQLELRDDDYTLYYKKR